MCFSKSSSQGELASTGLGGQGLKDAVEGGAGAQKKTGQGMDAPRET